MFESAAPLRAEFQELETALSDPAVHADLARARKVGRRYAELTPVIKALDEYARLTCLVGHRGCRAGGTARPGH
jgi:peptide chain release factor 1